jgi:hypothetical protein
VNIINKQRHRELHLIFNRIEAAELSISNGENVEANKSKKLVLELTYAMKVMEIGTDMRRTMENEVNNPST